MELIKGENTNKESIINSKDELINEDQNGVTLDILKEIENLGWTLNTRINKLVRDIQKSRDNLTTIQSKAMPLQAQYVIMEKQIEYLKLYGKFENSEKKKERISKILNSNINAVNSNNTKTKEVGFNVTEPLFDSEVISF